MPSLLNRARIIQNAYIVNDLKTACQTWHDIYGIGPFFIMEHLPIEEARYNGTVIDLDISVAFSQSGDVNIELIQQHNDGSSGFRDMYPKGHEGLHHVAVICGDYDSEVARFEAAGYPAPMQFRLNADFRVSFVDTRSVLGHMIELYEDNQGLHGLYSMVRESAESWDGKELFVEPGSI